MCAKCLYLIANLLIDPLLVCWLYIVYIYVIFMFFLHDNNLCFMVFLVTLLVTANITPYGITVVSHILMELYKLQKYKSITSFLYEDYWATLMTYEFAECMKVTFLGMPHIFELMNSIMHCVFKSQMCYDHRQIMSLHMQRIVLAKSSFCRKHTQYWASSFVVKTVFRKLPNIIQYICKLL